MKEIKLTKKELERLLNEYRKITDQRVGQLVDACRDLDHANDDELLAIYNAFCRYLRIDGLCVYRMNEFNSLEFADNTELKKLTENLSLDDQYFAMDLFGCRGYHSFNDLDSYLKYRIPLNLDNVKKSLEYTFEDEE